MKTTELAKQMFTNNHVRASEGNTDGVGKPGGVALAHESLSDQHLYSSLD